MSEPLHLKYRPTDFNQVLGRKNKPTIKAIESVITNKEIKQRVFLLQGPSGCGKTTIAKIMSTKLDINPMGLEELSISSAKGVDHARHIVDNIRRSPLGGGKRMIILNECNGVTKDFWNVMLETLEFTKNTYFILCTTTPESIPKEVKTRSATYQIHSLLNPEIESMLKDVCKKEGKLLSNEVISKIAELSFGSPREALVNLEKVVDMSNSKEQVKVLETTVFSEKSAHELSRLLLTPKPKWGEAAEILKGIGEDSEGVRYVVLGYMNKVLLGGDNPLAALVISEFLDSFVTSGKAGLTYAVYNCVINR